jgi:hypothetical protein
MMPLVTQEIRQHPRFRLALEVTVHQPAGPVATHTVGVSKSGLSLSLAAAPPIDSVVPLSIRLPDGSLLKGSGTCRSHRPQHVVGFSLELDPHTQARWVAFVDEEETTGSLWRMIGRIARAPDDAFAPRGLVVSDDAHALRFHTVGENGLAYRLAFHKHPSDDADESDLCILVPGFREPGRRLVRRVLREDVTLRFDESGDLVQARVVELNRGGYAYVAVQADRPVAIVSLAVGELLLVERDGKSVFPHLTSLELEQVACDTFRHDLSQPLFGKRTETAPRPVELPPLKRPPPPEATPRRSADPKRFTEGYDAVRFAQAASDDVQIRRYGERDIFFHPSVWAKVKADDGSEFMGPTMQDAGRVCVLGLVGPGAPRVVRLHEGSAVTLLKRPT